jgi:hypothetical protein
MVYGYDEGRLARSLNVIDVAEFEMSAESVFAVAVEE